MKKRNQQSIDKKETFLTYVQGNDIPRSSSKQNTTIKLFSGKSKQEPTNANSLLKLKIKNKGTDILGGEANLKSPQPQQENERLFKYKESKDQSKIKKRLLKKKFIKKNSSQRPQTSNQDKDTLKKQQLS